MITVLFSCPKCQMSCICGIQSQDDILSLANELPVRLRCGGCGIESFVTRNPSCNGSPAGGRWYRFFAHCLKIAAVCRRRAIETQNPSLQAFFLKRERYWLRTGWESDLHRDAAIIAARKAQVSLSGR